MPLRFYMFSLCFFLTFTPQFAAAKNFDTWLADARKDALEKGVSQKTIDLALPIDLKVNETTLRLDKKQPEGRITFTKYKKNTVNKTRIEKGRKMMRKHHKDLMRVSKKYNVQPQYIVALWGMETNYGGYTGGFAVPRALASLAYDGRRAEFFYDELMHSLKIIDEGHISADKMKGSWAGAMGQSQFMPSSFFKYAVDENGDGKTDIWQTKLDVFASAANYLKTVGWTGDERWGRRVTLPKGFDTDLVGRKKKKPLSTWRALGLKTISGRKIPVVKGMQGALVQPDGAKGETYLVYGNYDVLMDWNRSNYFATSVGLLADQLVQ